MNEEAALFRALADPIRLRLAALLAMRGETCVCELAHALGEPDFKMSRHLGVMRAAGLVEARREGTWMHYRLAQTDSALLRRLKKLLRKCLAEHPVVRDDLARLSDTACAPGKCG